MYSIKKNAFETDGNSLGTTQSLQTGLVCFMPSKKYELNSITVQ